jgi:hypothetical protein
MEGKRQWLSSIGTVLRDRRRSSDAFDERLRFQQSAFRRERVKGIDNQASRSSIGGHKAEWGKSESVLRMEQMEQSAFLAIRQELFVNAREQRFGKQLGRSLVNDCGRGKNVRLVPLKRCLQA